MKNIDLCLCPECRTFVLYLDNKKDKLYRDYGGNLYSRYKRSEWSNYEWPFLRKVSTWLAAGEGATMDLEEFDKLVECFEAFERPMRAHS